MSLSKMEAVHIVDTDAAIRDSLITLLKSFDLSVKAYSDSESFLREVGSTAKGCVLVEAEMPGLNGMGLLRELRNNDSTIPVVFLTSNASSDYIARAQNAGAVGVLQKPFIGEELMNQLKVLVR